MGDRKEFLMELPKGLLMEPMKDLPKEPELDLQRACHYSSWSAQMSDLPYQPMDRKYHRVGLVQSVRDVWVKKKYATRRIKGFDFVRFDRKLPEKKKNGLHQKN